MNKFVKVCLITAGILVVLGMIFSFISAAAGGRNMLHFIKDNVRQDGELDIIEGTLEDLPERIFGRKWYHNWGTNPTYLTVNGERVKTEVWERQIPAENIKNLSLELGAGEFYIREKDAADGMVDVTIEGVGGCKYQVKDNTLHVEGFTGIRTLGMSGNRNNLILTFPAGTNFGEIDIEAGAGTMEMVSLQAEEITVEVGAGEFIMNRMEAKELSAEIGAGRLVVSDMHAKDVSLMVGVGDCTYEGAITNELEAECSMGNIALTLDGKESDYNYELECSAGNIDINGSVVSGLASERSIQNGAARTLELVCSMGNISILFDE